VEVGWREAGKIGEIDEIALGRGGAGNNAPRRLDERALIVQGNEEGQLAQRAPGRTAALEKQGESLRREGARLGPVDTGIGPISDDAVGVLDHLGRDVRVVVEADRDRHTPTDRRPNAPQQLAFAVLEGLRHHRAVEVEIDAVDRHGLRQAPDELARDALEGIRRDSPACAAARPQERRDRVPVADRIEKTGQREARIGQRANDLRPTHERRPVAMAGEVRVVGVRGDE